MKRTATALTALVLALAACSEEPTTDEGSAPAEQGGKAAGDIEGGTISDAMIPLESLRSQSPALEPRPTTATTSGDEGGASTTAETTSAATSGDGEAPAPPPPAPPAAPGGRP